MQGIEHFIYNKLIKYENHKYLWINIQNLNIFCDKILIGKYKVVIGKRLYRILEIFSWSFNTTQRRK